MSTSLVQRRSQLTLTLTLLSLTQPANSTRIPSALSEGWRREHKARHVEHMSRRIICTDRKEEGLGTRGVGTRGIERGVGTRGIERGLREPAGEIVAQCLCQACRRTAARVRSLLPSAHHAIHCSGALALCANQDKKTRKSVCYCSRTGRGPQVYCLMRFMEGFRFSTIFKPKNHRSVRSVARNACCTSTST